MGQDFNVRFNRFRQYLFPRPLVSETLKSDSKDTISFPNIQGLNIKIADIDWDYESRRLTDR